jgi:hypothetical protein
MSDVVWCDTGGHLMSAADPEREYWTKPGNEYGNDQTKPRMDSCGKHKTAFIAFPDVPGPRDNRPKELDSVSEDEMEEFRAWQARHQSAQDAGGM